MTGIVFTTLSKFIEIGNIVNKGKRLNRGLVLKRENLKNEGWLTTNETTKYCIKYSS
jgi:hypothetical protein